MQKSIHNIGKHTACGEQHELTMHTEVFDVQVYVILSHDSKIEHRIPGAQYLLLLNVRYSKQGVDDKIQLLLLFELCWHCCTTQFDVEFHPECDDKDNVNSTVVSFSLQV